MVFENQKVPGNDRITLENLFGIENSRRKIPGIDALGQCIEALGSHMRERDTHLCMMVPN